jgi:hypothetical protein
MNDEKSRPVIEIPKPKATGHSKTADEIVNDAMLWGHSADADPHPLSLAGREQKAHEMFRKVHGRDPRPGEINVPKTAALIQDVLGREVLAFYQARWGTKI